MILATVAVLKWCKNGFPQASTSHATKANRTTVCDLAMFSQLGHVVLDVEMTALAFCLLVVALFLEGCGPETATDYDATTTTAFIFAIVILVLGFCCCCGMTVFFVLPKVCEKKRNIFSVETWCAMGSDREGACPGWCALVGCPCFLAIWPWLAWGMYTSGRNCETLQAMQPDLCEEWLTPAPVGFTQNLCCVASNTGTTSLARCESFSCESSGLAWVMPHPNGDSVDECCVATTAAPNVATTLTSTMTTSQP